MNLFMMYLFYFYNSTHTDAHTHAHTYTRRHTQVLPNSSEVISSVSAGSSHVQLSSMHISREGRFDTHVNQVRQRRAN